MQSFTAMTLTSCILIYLQHAYLRCHIEALTIPAMEKFYNTCPEYEFKFKTPIHILSNDFFPVLSESYLSLINKSPI